MTLRARLVLLATLVVGLVASCMRKDEALTYAEAQQALEDASVGTQAEMLVGSSVEIATNFTIGDIATSSPIPTARCWR